MTTTWRKTAGTRILTTLAVIAGLGMAISPLMGGCADSGSDGAAGAAGAAGAGGVSQATDTTLDEAEDLPGCNLVVTALSGGSGAGGSFQVGNMITVTFTIKKNDGTNLPASELNNSAIYVSGPTFNYQRVIASTSDWHTAATQNPDGSWTYQIPTAIPATYLAPIGDDVNFTDGELTGTALLSGTYSVGMQAYKTYTQADGASVRDAGSTTKDFLFGTAATLDPREVVKKENCNQCHVNLEKHGSRRRDTKLCVLCHTAGMEDTNDPAIEGGTPDVTLEFKVMIHRIHNAAHLPSAVGVQTNASGVRTYNNVPKPYVVVDDTEVDDMSEVGFPVWPNMSYAMPRNKGYGALSGTGLNGKTYQANDDTIRTGAAECSKCHGAGSGFTAPAQGNIAYTQPSRRVCGACHDDVQFGLNNGSGYCFVKNDTSGMPTQLNDSACATCHSPAIETDLSVTRVHVHPLNNSTYNPGFNAAITAITPSSGTTLDPGETLAYTFSISQTAGVFDPTLANQTLYFVLAGPTNNRNLIHYTSISAKVLTGAGPYTINVPQPVSLAYVGNDIAGLQTWPTTGGTPLWQSADATAVNNSTTVYEVTSYAPASGGLSTLTIAGAVNDDYVTVGLIDNFRKGEYVVIDRGFAGEEYLQLAGVVSDTSITTGPGKLYFIGTSMYSTLSRVRLRNPHIAGAEIREVTLTARTVTTQYTVTGATGLITEVAGFTNAGNGVVVSYTTNWTMPATYPPPYGDSTAIGESWGEWQGKSIAEGTYTLGFWVGRSSIAVIFPPGQGESTSYTAPSLLASGGDFLVGGATEIEPYGFISSPDNCKACHNDPQFHGGSRRGAATCLMCHGQAGAEDGPQRVWTQSTAATPVYPLATAGTSINYRTMLHKIHRGSGLFYASTYAVVGNGGTAHYYDEITFPPMPGGVKHCDKCHGSSNDAWKEPSDRAHPTEQVGPMTRWRPVCGSCHDAPDNSAHFDLMTAPSGAESCGTCHGLGKVYNIQMMHKNR